LFACNYYGMCSGLSDANMWGGMASCPTSQRALFNMGTGLSIADITDGTSNSLAVVEYLTGLNNTDVRGWIYTNRGGGQFLYAAQTPNNSLADNLLNISSSYINFCSSGYNNPSMNLPCTGDNTGNSYGIGMNNSATSRSRHPGGVNVVFCDGHVSFIPNSITQGTWQALAWIQDGQVVPNY
jgi:prepilin-type processing-associated H-X9-DG protein